MVGLTHHITNCFILPSQLPRLPRTTGHSTALLLLLNLHCTAHWCNRLDQQSCSGSERAPAKLEHAAAWRQGPTEIYHRLTMTSYNKGGKIPRPKDAQHPPGSILFIHVYNLSLILSSFCWSAHIKSIYLFFLSEESLFCCSPWGVIRFTQYFWGGFPLGNNCVILDLPRKRYSLLICACHSIWFA